jgi:hypothetical protein
MKKLYKFQEKLKRTKDSLKAYDFMPNDYRHYSNEHIRFENGYRLSIQCSSGMYCSPRISQVDPTLYDEYEVGIIHDDFSVDLTEFFKKIDHRHVEETWLAAYVPSEKVQMIYDHVELLKTRKIIIQELLDDENITNGSLD